MSEFKKNNFIEEKRKILIKHYQKYIELQNEGNWKESLLELRKTLECISDLMRYSANSLTSTVKNYTDLPPEQKQKVQRILLSYFIKNYPNKNIILNRSKTYH
jgi:hypothetical protein